MAELPEGTVFAGHRIDGIAGRGGMGVVYRATHLALDHPVALKVIAAELADDPRFRERFVRESRTAVAIRHPNVVQVRHAGEEDGVLFVTMDYIEGSDLRAVINAERRLDPPRAARIAAQVAAALDAAHERGLVHRDVKPGNVLIEDRAGTEHVYLTDFGLTKRMSGATELTASGAFIGTLEYMAPEQIRGGELDARTDVYALAGVAFAMVTGEPPFGRVDGDVAKLYAHLNDPPPRASERAPGLPAALDPVLQRGMAKDPGERYSSAGEFARALEVAAGVAAAEATAPVAVAVEPTEEAEPVTEVTREAPRDRGGSGGRRRALGAVAGLGVAAALAGAILVAGGDGDGDDGGGTAGAGKPEKVARGPAGDFPIGVTLDEQDQLLVASREDGELLALDPETLKPIVTSTIEGGETDFIVKGDGTLWTADAANDQLLELDPETLEQIDEYPTGSAPRDILVTDELVWVANRESNNFTRLDLASGTTDEIAAAGDYPRRLIRDEAADRMWAAFRESGSVQGFDVETGEAVTDAVELGGEPHGMAIAGGRLWVANTGLGSVQRISLDDPTAPPEEFTGICQEPRDVRIAFDAAWVACGGGEAGEGELVKLGLDGQLLDTVELGVSAENIAASERLGLLWVTGGENGGVIAIDPGV